MKKTNNTTANIVIRRTVLPTTRVSSCISSPGPETSRQRFGPETVRPGSDSTASATRKRSKMKEKAALGQVGPRRHHADTTQTPFRHRLRGVCVVSAWSDLAQRHLLLSSPWFFAKTQCRVQPPDHDVCSCVVCSLICLFKCFLGCS